MHTPYTYRVTSKTTGQHYYGVRYAQNCHPSDLWVKYFTSSKLIKALIEEHGEDDFDIGIDKTFPGDPAAARAYEDKFLIENGCVHSDKWINRGRCGEDFYNDGHTEVTNEKIARQTKARNAHSQPERI